MREEMEEKKEEEEDGEEEDNILARKQAGTIGAPTIQRQLLLAFWRAASTSMAISIPIQSKTSYASTILPRSLAGATSPRYEGTTTADTPIPRPTRTLPIVKPLHLFFSANE